MQINSSELFLDSILLLINDNSRATLDAIAKLISISKSHIENGVGENEITKLYLTILTEIYNKKLTKDNTDQLRILILRFKDDPRLKNDVLGFKLLQDMFLSDERLTEQRIADLRISITNAIVWNTIKDQYQKGFGQLYKSSGINDPYKQEASLLELVESTSSLKTMVQQVSTTGSSNAYPGLIESINLSKRDDMRVALRTNDTVVQKGAFRLGLQGMTRMFGKVGGPVRGESMVICAPSHGYKSYMLSSLARWIAQYNEPPEVAPGKRPLIWMCSLENAAWRNACWIFRRMWEIEYLRSSEGLSEEEILDYVTLKFQDFGWDLIIDRFIPDTFGYHEYVRRYENLEAQGFEIVVAVVDYMNKMKKDPNLSRDLGVRELYSQMVNYNGAHKTALFTAHQLNRTAAALKTIGTQNIVRKYNTDMLADSTDVFREVDFLMFLHIEKVGKTAYLTMSRENGKHRHGDDTPIEDQYTAYAFTDFGIVDDIDRKDASVKDIYAEGIDTTDLVGFQSSDIY